MHDFKLLKKKSALGTDTRGVKAVESYCKRLFTYFVHIKHKDLKKKLFTWHNIFAIIPKVTRKKINQLCSFHLT